MQLFIRNNIKLKFCIAALFLFVIVNTLSCKKEPIPDYYMADSVRAYVSFKPGSYWIYKDDSTGTEDSIWVTSLKSKWEARVISDEVVANDERLSCKININDSTLSGEFSALQTAAGYRLYDWVLGFDLDEKSQYWNNILFYKDSVFVDSLRYDHVLNYFVAFTPIETYRCVYFKPKIGILKWVVRYNDGHYRRQHLVRYFLAQ